MKRCVRCFFYWYNNNIFSKHYYIRIITWLAVKKYFFILRIYINYFFLNKNIIIKIAIILLCTYNTLLNINNLLELLNYTSTKTQVAHVNTIRRNQTTTRPMALALFLLLLLLPISLLLECLEWFDSVLKLRTNDSCSTYFDDVPLCR